MIYFDIFTIFTASLFTFEKVKHLKPAIIGFSLIKVAKKPWNFLFILQNHAKHYFAEDHVLVNLDHMIHDLKDIFKNVPHMA